MAKGLMNIEVDTSSVSELNGFITHATQGIKTDRHMDSVMDYTFAEMSEEFSQDVDEDARVMPGQFHHIYEWNRIGDPTARLFRPVMRGSPGNKVISFQWLASKTTVPVPSNEDIERADGKDHTDTLKQVHVFVWKAPIMEYDISVLIKPSGSGVLAMLRPGEGIGQYTLFFTRASVQVDHPGGISTTGKLTRKFATWWGGAGSEQVFESRIRQTIDGQLGLMEKEISRIGTRSRTKSFKMSTASQSMAFAEGRRHAEAWITSVVSNYRAMANARKALMADFGEEF